LAIVSKVVEYSDIIDLSDVDAHNLCYSKLYRYCTANPKEFMEIVESKNIEALSTVKKYIDRNILKVSEEGLILDAKTDTLIGNNMKSAVAYLMNPTNEVHKTKYETIFKTLVKK
jgi:DNA-binding ferritin-like protein (Dps family)